MKILVVNPFGGGEPFGEENLSRIARPDTEFDTVNIKDAYPLRKQSVALLSPCVHGWDVGEGDLGGEAGLRRGVHLVQP